FAARSKALAGSPGAAASMARVVADYIAGMTDRFATREHERLSGQRLLP
ncbi:MAG: deoxyguanosinetriphosphate triphosphohydrolase, partial [Betaproteobacteria bacterium]|nr:deoxyguanosinetriphosphate triphosphohydrolase [Betaproteobacteria bacterium]NDE74311.1 deoxyguanosinetriphosphate triphosphohydrolase [Betaproteobacteria bacterium]